MCGIAGIVTKTGVPPSKEALLRMAGAIAHRGPDGEGVWVGSGVGFAHRRLAIIDLDHRADQPMMSADGRYTIVFNGEIYNYRELRSQLQASWKTEGDTEVILEGYRAWGPAVADKLRGMFAFAIWDEERRQLCIARDKIGKKPLFYATTKDGDVAFASEIKALRSVVDLRPDVSDVRTFLGLQYVPTPRTGFIGVSQLPPGHSAIFERGSFTAHSYHNWSRESREMTDADVDDGIRSRLDEAVKLRMLAADVPVGAFLSGGVDSAAVVAYASTHVDALQTFTMGFAGAPDMDERNEAQEIAKRFNTKHHAFEAKPEDLLNLIDELVTHYDAPYADSSALPLWLLAKETSKQIKVVLTGDGGDETFGGYKRYVAYQQALELATMPLVGSVTAPASYWLGGMLHDPRFDRFGYMAEVMRSRPETAYGELFCGSYFNSRVLKDVCHPDFLQQTAKSDAVECVAQAMGNEASLDAALFFDLTSYLPDDLNVKMDRATMRFGLEARAPFLDQEMVQFALGLPLNQKVSRGKTKIALKRALKPVLPKEVLERKKRGFQVPLGAWFRGPLASLVKERCLDPKSPLTQIVRLDAVQRLIDENQKGADHGNRLWMLLALSSWLNTHHV
jgi:asparagine synthase (glutamine-hydrolysing)